MLGLLLVLALPAAAGDHDRIRAWVAEGRILPLARVLESLPAGLAGRLLEVELEQRHDRPVYEIEWLAPDGRVLEFAIDARDGRLLTERSDDTGPRRRGRDR